jgi:hypothetical protein
MPNKDYKNTLKVFQSVKEKNKFMSTQKQIEVEEVAVKLPKRVMDFLRLTEENPIAWIECKIVEVTLSDTDCMSQKDWVEAFHLGPPFKET